MCRKVPGVRIPPAPLLKICDFELRSEEQRGDDMGKMIYTINGKMYIIDDETGKIKTVEIKDDPIPQRDLEELIKILAKNQKGD